jgi:MOSC domain-containing protein YiiM
MDAPRLLSVQAGVVRDLGRAGAASVMDRPWSSAIVKEPVTGRRRVGRLGLEGDEQADQVNHGGADKALLAYGAENLATWEPILGVVPPPGGFGENLTISGLDERSVCIGDRFRIGTVMLECSQPRQPCWKLGRRWRRGDLPKHVNETGRSGWYLRVLVEGELGEGDVVERLDSPHPEWSVTRASRVMNEVEGGARAIAALASLPELSSAWRETLDARRA